MCSPSRASVFTGRYPAEHGVELTLTAADLRPDPRNLPGVFATMGDIVRKREVPVGRLASRFARGALQLGPKSGGEPELPADLPNVATLLRAAGYHVAYKGKWHLTHPLGGGEPLLGGWGYRDAGPARGRLRVRRVGAAGRRRERQGLELRRRQRRRRGGLGRGLHAPGRALARPRGAAGAVLPDRLAGQPP